MQLKTYIKYVNKINLGIGDWGLGPIPNPQSPIPNFNSYSNIHLKSTLKLYKYYFINIYNNIL